MPTQILIGPIGNEVARPLNTDVALLSYFSQRVHQIVDAAASQTAGGRLASVDRYYRQALIYLHGLEWMVLYGEIDPELKEETKAQIGTFIKMLAEMHLRGTLNKPEFELQ
ncbi:MAG: hypothetical protein HY282_13285 [Nitrospirae bacterium]|nr:hypothetical protein [Candidatus Manganitrophaceae bacterium]